MDRQHRRTECRGRRDVPSSCGNAGNGVAGQEASREAISGVYVICFEEPIAHARHYCGASDDVVFRLLAHRAGRGSALTRRAVLNNIGMRIGRVLRSQDPWSAERQLKAAKDSSRFCLGCCGAWRKWPNGMLLPDTCFEDVSFQVYTQLKELSEC